MSPMRRIPCTVLFAFLAACGHSDGGSAPAPTGGGAPGGQTATTSTAQSAALPSRAVEAEPARSTEKFSDGERAFRAAKDALLNGYYAPGLSEDELYRAAAEGMLANADAKMQKWNKLLSPLELGELEADLKGEVVGVGVRINFEPANGHIAVLGTVPGSPAEREKLRAGDEILSVDGKLYKGRSVRDVVHDIRGKAGDSVTLAVLRDDKVLNVTLKREVVPIDVASGGMLAGDIGYLRVHTFHEKTPSVVKGVLATLTSARAMVVDLRSNGGGLFDEAIQTASYFLKPGTPIVKIEKRGQPAEVLAAKGERIVGDLPMVVLVNEDTASGAELVAAALSEGRGAQLVGGHTFGKWSVQKLEKLPNGFGIKYTTSLFAPPSGRAYGGVGVTPDVEVAFGGAAGDKNLDRLLAQPDLAKRAADDPQLRTALGLLRPR